MEDYQYAPVPLSSHVPASRQFIGLDRESI